MENKKQGYKVRKYASPIRLVKFMKQLYLCI